MPHAQAVIELPRWVPMQHRQFQPWVVTSDGNSSEGCHQLTAYPLTAYLLDYKDVFEVNSGTPLPGRIGGEEQGKAHWPAVQFGNERFELGMFAKAVAQQIVHRRLNRIRLTLESGKPSYESKDGFDVGGRCRADGDFGHQQAFAYG